MIHCFSQNAFINSLRTSLYRNQVEDAFTTSKTFQTVNPLAHAARVNSVTQDVPASKLPKVSDEELLARFTSGFFGGRVFGPERFILGLGLWKLFPTRFKGFEDDADAIDIFSKRTIPKSTLLPLGSRFFGLFKVLGKSIAEVGDGQASSHVDYAFGSDVSTFAGCHRFQMTRLQSSEENTEKSKGEPVIRFSLQCFTCNPQLDKPLTATTMEYFHRFYAKLLFADALSEALQ